MDLFEEKIDVPLYPIQEFILSELRKTMGYHKRVVLMAPTGLGKTQIAIEIIKRAKAKGKKCCFVCHRITLVDQTSKALNLQGIHHGVLQGNHPDFFPDRDVQVCSIQTLAKRKIYDKFDIFFFDEIQVFFKQHIEIINRNKEAFFIGLSATPFTKGLGKYFSSLCNPVSLKDLIAQKILKSFDIYGPCSIDLTNVKTVAGEWKKDDLEKAADKPKLTADIVATWLKLAKNRKTIVFSSGVSHSAHLEKEFLKHGIKAVEVNGYMKKDSTKLEIGAKQIIEDFKNGKYQVIISVEMLVSGFDVTDVSCVVLATSTKSMMKFSQAVGRGLRKHEGLENCIVLDHGSITERLGFPDDFEFIELDDGKHLEAKNKKKEKVKKLPKRCPSCDFIKPAGVSRCPKCGYQTKNLSEMETAKGELKKLKRKDTKLKYTIEAKQSFLNQLNQYAYEKGFKKSNGVYGWSLYQYEDKFGSRPANFMNWDLREKIGSEVENWVKYTKIRYLKGKQNNSFTPKRFSGII